MVLFPQQRKRFFAEKHSFSAKHRSAPPNQRSPPSPRNIFAANHHRKPIVTDSKKRPFPCVNSREPTGIASSMASLRTQTAAHLLRNAVRPRIALASVPRRFGSSVNAPADVVPAMPGAANQPDYDAPIDKATSTYTPVPKRVQDGTEDVLAAATISGAPVELQARTVRIYKETKPATQSGEWRGERWRMDWDILPKGHRWENPLIGWQSSGDFMQGTHINFKSKEDAIHFAEKQGYEYFVQEPNSRKFTPKAYANNFLYTPNKLKHIRTK